jgi:exodeoxyribonuclease V alpha subunit
VQTRNDYTLGVMNGEIGIVTEKRRDHPMVVDGRMQRQDVVMVHFGDRAVPYPILASYGLQLAYAITAHKSQGSEWMHTAVAFDDSAGPLLSREWLYTAVTRAKDSLLLVAPERAIRRAMGRSVLAERQTGLAMRIQEAIA